MRSKSSLSGSDLLQLQQRAVVIRKHVIDMLYSGGSGHPGGCLSAVEILATLYFQTMKLRPEEPLWLQRDRFVLSKGHAAPLLYAVLAEAGFFPLEWLKTFQKNGTRLQKHLDMHKVPGVEVSTGSLAQGLSVAAGMALADRIDGLDRSVYALIGDGESQEGQIWEAALAAAQLKLDRLIVFLDQNRLQVDGWVEEINSLEPLADKWRAFRWHVLEIDGHDFHQIHDALEEAHQHSGAPHLILAHTTKGKGISFMENRFEWHSKALSEDQYHQALDELDQAAAAVGGGR
ncbi:MAG: transketolase [Anaerolineales bacterium]|nr:transketolase [Anaerolineales bacterium]